MLFRLNKKCFGNDFVNRKQFLTEQCFPKTPAIFEVQNTMLLSKHACVFGKGIEEIVCKLFIKIVDIKHI